MCGLKLVFRRGVIAASHDDEKAEQEPADDEVSGVISVAGANYSCALFEFFGVTIGVKRKVGAGAARAFVAESRHDGAAVIAQNCFH